jgi:hypothetical protein
MGDKIRKIITIIKKDGFLNAMQKVYKYIKAKYISKINFFSYIYIKLNYKKIKAEINKILNEEYDRIVIWRGSFGWNVPLFQRPQHIAKELSHKSCLVFYEVTTVTDKVKTFKKIYDKLYLINFNNIAMKKLLFNELNNIKKPKYIQFYSTDNTISVEQLKKYIESGYKILYEYIDDLSPLIVGTKELPINIKDKYEYMLRDTENVFVVVTADDLEKDVVMKRGKEKLVFSCNGVDYEHFANIQNVLKYDVKFSEILEQKKPIIGYYGALATWFDYDMIKYLASQKTEYNIVLLGIKYDESFDKAGLSEYKNIYFLGSKPYDDLPHYARNFDVCTIPFLINDITQATSPLKLFEYMALGKPIVTTEMNECKKYKSVMIARDNKIFVEMIDKAILINKDRNSEYFKILRKEALENTWEAKTLKIIDLLKEYE